MHIYIFGSLCRGEIARDSDTDLLAVTRRFDSRLDPDAFSIYSYGRIRALWREGNPFAWHLAIEAKLVFASDNRDFLQGLEKPAPYTKCAEDCRKFFQLYEAAIMALASEGCSQVFELSTIFLAVRNFATCFSLGVTNHPNFSRDSARKMGRRSLRISDETYDLLQRSRVLSTRGYGSILRRDEIVTCFDEIRAIGKWMNALLTEIGNYERVQ